MSPPRTPVVLGVGQGIGATTLAAALHAHDGGQRDVAADVVVCGGTEESLRRAEALGLGVTRPLLAVVAAGPEGMPGRLRHTGRRYASTTVLPHVGRWRGLAGPTEEIATLLGLRPELLTPALRAYADGLREIAAGLLRSGLLRHDRPPVVARPVLVPRPAAVANPATITVPQQRTAPTTNRAAAATPQQRTAPTANPAASAVPLQRQPASAGEVGVRLQ